MFKNIFKLIVIFYLLSFGAFAETFSKFNVKGNQRVSSQAIINFSLLKIGDDLTINDLNNSLKEIYETNFFEDVSVNITDNTLNIIVKEYPIIQNIEFNGIKAKKFIKILDEQVELKVKSSFNKFSLQKDVEKISNILRQSGYYFSKVNVKQQINTNDTINLIYNVTMGEKALISKIKFIGDKKFKSTKLMAVIASEESKFWKFISRNKYLDREKTKLDKRLLRNFYLNKGYYNVNVEDANTQLLDKKSFFLTYKIDSGLKFSFNNFEIVIPEDYNEKDFIELKKIFKNLKNTTYNYRSIDDILSEIDKIALIKNYEFIDVTVNETVENNNKINFVFNVKEGDKFYVERINILGNNITNEEFIRQQIIVDEGDPFNKLLHNKSINKLRNANIFKSVKSEVIEGKNNGLKVLDITVEEKPTGEISAGAGYGSSGSSFSVGIKENNFAGKGIKLDTNLTLTEDSIRGMLSYTNPNFAYSDRSLTTSLESTSIDKEEKYGFKTSLNRIAVGTRFEQYENFYFSPTLSVASEDLTTTALASANYKKQEGSYFDTVFNYSLTYDKRNSVYKPSDGTISTFLQEVPLISDGAAIVNGYQITTYNEIFDEAVLSIGLFTRTITSLKSNTDVRVSKRLFLPESKLRGFEAGKVGPKDGNDYVGGNYMASFNSALNLPFLLPTFDKLDFSLFFDVANIWHVDYSQQVDQGNTVRSSTGIAVDILTPVGPLSFSLTQPITKAEGDKTESVRFNLGTTF